MEKIAKDYGFGRTLDFLADFLVNDFIDYEKFGYRINSEEDMYNLFYYSLFKFDWQEDDKSPINQEIKEDYKIIAENNDATSPDFEAYVSIDFPRYFE